MTDAMKADLPTYVWRAVSPYGSREHYFHFLIGYLLPIVHAQTINRFERFGVLECGPLMTPILEQTLDRLAFSFRVVEGEVIRHRVAIPTWDLDLLDGLPRGMVSAAEVVREAWAGFVCPREDCPDSDNLLLRRSEPHRFYLDGPAEIKGYGTSRRAIVNLDEVSARLAESGVPHSVYEPGVHPLGCQIACFSTARRILGIRGAEWANVIWSRNDPRVRILDPGSPAGFLTGLLDGLGISYELRPVAENQVAEDPLEAERFLTAGLSDGRLGAC